MSNDANVPSTQQPGHLLHGIAATLGKGLLYALAFWAVYAFVYTPAYYATRGGDSSEEQTNRQMDAWDEQSRRSAAMLDDQAELQRRYETLLSRQEQQIQRMDAILSAWERQSGVKK